MLRWMTLSVAATALLSVVPVFGRGDGTFRTPLVLRNVPHPVGVAAGDFNRDDKLDLAIVHSDSQVTIFLQDPSRRTEWLLQPRLRVGSGCFHIRADDLDGDGDHDLLIADPQTSAYFVRSNGDGTFEQPLRLTQAKQSRSTAVGDIDGDGRLDVVTANHGDVSISIYMGGPDGALTFRETKKMTEEPHAVEIFDFDGDGVLDVILGVSDAGLLPLKGTGGGAFRPLPVVKSLGCVEFIAAGDFNRDGKVDLATTCFDFGDAAVGISKGDGTFKTILDDRMGFLGLIPAVADMNGDGMLDLMVAKPEVPRLLRIYPGSGDGTFVPPVDFGPMPSKSTFLVAKDLDGDGFADIVSTQEDGTVTIFWGRQHERPIEESPQIRAPTNCYPPFAILDRDANGYPDVLMFSSAKSDAYLFLNPASTLPLVPSATIPTGFAFRSTIVFDINGDGTTDFGGVDMGLRQFAVLLLDAEGKVESAQAFPLCPEASNYPTTVVGAHRPDMGDAIMAVLCKVAKRIHLFHMTSVGDLLPLPDPVLDPIPWVEDVAIEDLDADGRLDLLIRSTARIYALFGKEGGDFAQAVDLLGTAVAKPVQVAARDVDGDSTTDLVVLESDRLTLLTFRGKGNGAFEAAPTTTTLTRTARHFGLADLNGDGILDLATAPYAGRTITVYLGRGLEFELGGSYETTATPTHVDFADMDLDSALDILAEAGGSLITLYGRPIATESSRFVRGDADGDGKVEVNDPVAALNRFFLGGERLPCDDAADANDDGLLDLADPIFTLNHLFLGGEAPPTPGPAGCGDDPTLDTLRFCREKCP